MELKKLTERVYYIPGSANIGVITCGEKSAVLVDSGLDDDAAKRILGLVIEKGLTVKAIINTHSHADHCGGNRYIKEKTGAEIYAPELESAIIQYPLLEPLYLFSGASPLKDLQNKFLMAKPSNVDHVIKSDATGLKFDGLGVGVIPLPGHALNQIGVEVDGVLFCADSLFSKDVLKKHKIPFCVDVDEARKTLEFLKNAGYKFYVPSHAEPGASLAELAGANLEAMDGVEKRILDGLAEMKTTEQILKKLCDYCLVDLKGIQQYYLMNTVVMAYLSSLHGRGKLQISVKNNSLFWKRV